MGQIKKKPLAKPGTAKPTTNPDGSTVTKTKGGATVMRAGAPAPAFMANAHHAPTPAPPSTPTSSGGAKLNVGNPTGNTGPGLPPPPAATTAPPPAFFANKSGPATPPPANSTINNPIYNHQPSAAEFAARGPAQAAAEAALMQQINKTNAAAGKPAVTDWSTGLQNPNVAPGTNIPPQVQTILNQTGGPLGTPGTTTPPPLTTDQVIQNQLGTGTPTNLRDTTDPNSPMYAAAQRAMQQNLAQIRARYGASGFGDSGREALAEGDATGAFGGQIASIGENAYQNDANRRLQAALAAQGLNLNAQGLQMQGQGQLANLGQALNAIGAGEQSPQNLQALLALLGLTMGQTGTGDYGSQGTQTSGFLSY